MSIRTTASSQLARRNFAAHAYDCGSSEYAERQ
jgi:hypothetical protein